MVARHEVHKAEYQDEVIWVLLQFFVEVDRHGHEDAHHARQQTYKEYKRSPHVLPVLCVLIELIKLY